MNQKVLELLSRQELSWVLTTIGDFPHAIAVNFKHVTEDGKLAIADVFMNETIRNIQASGKASVMVYEGTSLKSYEVRGTAEYLTEGALVEHYKEIVSEAFHGAMTAKGVVLVTPSEAINLTPGAEVNQKLN